MTDHLTAPAPLSRVLVDCLRALSILLSAGMRLLLAVGIPMGAGAILALAWVGTRPPSSGAVSSEVAFATVYAQRASSCQQEPIPEACLAALREEVDALVGRMRPRPPSGSTTPLHLRDQW